MDLRIMVKEAVSRILAGETVEKSDIIQMGHGGFCSNCSDCTFPDCSVEK